ncbi:hypothetical protein HN51_057582 [Arachis hypogaea]|uniref:transcriptional corepressor LEUNIG isoform X1 n=2 Tax=Arachis TaxID=3817 RepID=UPI000DED7DF0|nr:transcriptional corepressor LEUNIG isoform X1 [Arachis hypogaea]QHN80541.1 Transcriptional corepressor LEUNIG [Arachis hypogaea]
MSHANWEADKMLDVYIYDYLMKRQLHASARAFQAEGNVSTDPVAIDAPSGFLFEWWSVFWDIYIARTDQKHSEAAAIYSKTQQSKARELQKHQEQELQNPNQRQQMQMQLYMQRYAQQQEQEQQLQEQRQQQLRAQLVGGSGIRPINNDPSIRQKRATSNAMATRVYEDRLKLPLQRDDLDDVAIKQKGSGNVGQLLDPNHASLLKGVAVTTGGQATGQTSLGAPNILQGSLQQVQNQNQHLPGSLDMKSDMNPMVRPQAVISDGSFVGGHGSNQGCSNLTLKGWPLAGLDQLRSEFLQQNNLMQPPHSLNHLSVQQQLILQAQQHAVGSPSATDFENRRLRMLLNNPNMGLVKDGRSNSAYDSIPNVLAAQVCSPMLTHPDTDMFLKQQMQNSSHQLQQHLQHPPSNQQLQNLQRQGKIGSGSNTQDGCMSTLQGNDQASKTQVGRKRKQASSSGPANSSGTATTTGPSTSSPSTPSTQTLGDVPNLQQNVPSSKSVLMFGTDSLGSLTSAQNQLADMDCLIGDGTFSDNVESLFSADDADPRDKIGKEFSFKETKCVMASTHKVECCHFSSDGKLFATGGHDKKVSLWCTESFNLKSTLEEHTQLITDVRFSSSRTSRLATSSADKTVRIWDTENPGYSLRTFTGHGSTVMSLDFHPSKDDLIFSCDNNEIRYWSIKNDGCAGVYKGGVTQMRFQPRLGRLLAAAVDNLISIIDVETLGCTLKLQGHNNLVRSVCWNNSGKYLASLSDDLVRVWTVGSSSKGECIHELNASRNKFNTCAFHPFYPFLIIGCNEAIELWDFVQNKTLTLAAHEKLVSSLAVSSVNGLVASTSHDKHFKIWN